MGTCYMSCPSNYSSFGDDDDDKNNNSNNYYYIAEVIKLEKYVEHIQDPLMQIVRTHQHNTNSTLFQTGTNFKKSLQSDTK
jgi:hypothetical protein